MPVLRLVGVCICCTCIRRELGRSRGEFSVKCCGIIFAAFQVTKATSARSLCDGTVFVHAETYKLSMVDEPNVSGNYKFHVLLLTHMSNSIAWGLIYHLDGTEAT